MTDENGSGEHPAARNGLHVPSTASLPSRNVTHAVDVKMLEMLVCPLTHTTLEHDDARRELVSRAARLAFPIRDGIPIMLASEARQLTDEEMQKDKR